VNVETLEPRVQPAAVDRPASREYSGWAGLLAHPGHQEIRVAPARRAAKGLLGYKVPVEPTDSRVSLELLECLESRECLDQLEIRVSSQTVKSRRE